MSERRWVKAYWSEEDVTFYWEVDGEGWVLRSAEFAGAERRPQAAATLEETLRERDGGDLHQYEARFGVVPETPLREWDFPHDVITPQEFEEAWKKARATVESQP